MSTINELDVRSDTIRARRAAERGHARYNWLDTWHTFSFNTYYDPAHMGFRALRVINEDWVQPGEGFGMHGHEDMEIITYVLEGALEHRDSLGTGSVLRPGEFQHMSAGTGIRHSEFNPSVAEPVHLYQIWLLPDRKGLPPSYDQKTFPEAEKRGRLQLVTSPDARDGSLLIHQDARVYLSLLETGKEVRHELQTRPPCLAASSPRGGGPERPPACHERRRRRKRRGAACNPGYGARRSNAI